MPSAVRALILPNGKGPLNWLPRLVTIVAVLSCLISIAFLANDVRDRLEALRAANSDNLQWIVMQTEVEALRLEQAIAAARDARSPAETGAALKEVRRWFNVYYSRIAMLESSELHGTQLKQSEYHADVHVIHSYLDRSVPLIDGPDAALQAALPELAEGAAQLRESSRAVTLKSLADFSARSDIEREEMASTLLRLAAITGLLMLLLVTFLAGTAVLYRTATRQAEELRQTGGRLSTIVSTSADAIVVTDRAGIIQEFNPAAQVIFGMTRQEALGTSALGGLFIDDRDTAEGTVLAAALSDQGPASHGALRIEVDARRRDGSRFPAEVSIASTRPTGDPLIVAFVRDISDRRKARADLESALDRAVAGEQAKARMLAVMSHEIRTPLNGLIGSMALLDDSPLNADQRKVLRMMEASGTILLDHVNAVLDISRTEAGAQQFANVPFDLEQVIRDVMDNQAGLAESAGNRMVLTALGGPIGRVTGDPGKLRQLLLNLIGNAVKFTTDGEITVETERLPSSDGGAPGPMVEIRVIDTGIGIAEADVGRIFDDFVTLDTRYARTAGGTGLGLGITRRLTEAMGGQIGAESELGEGSLFWLRLPLPPAHAAADEPMPAAPDPAPRARPAAAAQPLEVLVVEDNEINRFLLRRYLEGAGHHVTEAQDGAEGVAAALTRRFDVILMDISMPRMDGVEATRRIRSIGGWAAQTRILALTAHALPEDLDRFRAAGMESTLTKPISREALLAALDGPMDTTPDPAPPAESLPTEAPIIVDTAALQDLQQQIGSQNAVGSIQHLIQDGDRVLSVLRAGLTRTDQATELAAHCHQLAGTAGTFGTIALHRALVALEQRLHRGDLACLDQDIAGVDGLWQATRRILLTELDALGDSAA